MRRMFPIILFAVFLVPIAVWAGRSDHRQSQAGSERTDRSDRMEGRRKTEMRYRVGEKIKLTAEQRAEIDKLRTEFRLEQIDRTGELRKAEIRFRELRRNDPPQRAGEANQRDKAMGAIDEIARQKAEIAKMRYDHEERVRQTFSEKQRAQIRELRAKRETISRFKAKQRTESRRGHKI